MLSCPKAVQCGVAGCDDQRSETGRKLRNRTTGGTAVTRPHARPPRGWVTVHQLGASLRPSRTASSMIAFTSSPALRSTPIIPGSPHQEPLAHTRCLRPSSQRGRRRGHGIGKHAWMGPRAGSRSGSSAGSGSEGISQDPRRSDGRLPSSVSIKIRREPPRSRRGGTL